MKRFLRLFAIAAIAGAVVTVPTASARSNAPAGLAVPQSDSVRYTLKVVEKGPGGGTITSSPAGIDCPGTCVAAFPAGTQVTLTVTPDPTSVFGSWTAAGCRVGSSTCAVTVNRAMTVTAYFTVAANVWLLSVELTGNGSGTVTSSPAGIDCPIAACGVGAYEGAQYTLTATADPGSTFVGWSDDPYSAGTCSGTGTCVVTLVPPLSRASTVYATFTSDSPPPPVACVVPNVIGKTLAAANRRIRSHHCSVGKVTKVKSSPTNKGRVISESPKAGQHLKNGAKIALKLGR
jgi:hypothetical protein